MQAILIFQADEVVLSQDINFNVYHQDVSKKQNSIRFQGLSKDDVMCSRRCNPCPVVKPTFLCGTDNRTYSSLCRLDYHNCIHHTVIRVGCKGFCPCKGKNCTIQSMITSEKLKAVYFTSKLNFAAPKNVAYLSNIDHPLLGTFMVTKGEITSLDTSLHQFGIKVILRDLLFLHHQEIFLIPLMVETAGLQNVGFLFQSDVTCKTRGFYHSLFQLSFE